MKVYKVKTTVDITQAVPDRNRLSATPLENAQQSNFNSLVQGIELRALVQWNHSPQMVEHPSVENEWYWEFNIEREDVFLKDNDHVGLLKEDLNNVPIIPHLKETIKFKNPVFVTEGEDQNIWIRLDDSVS
tara:strand:- start:2 stop:394 length:393 start_codon:yes stop_codon:yes gene_type:complete